MSNKVQDIRERARDEIATAEWSQAMDERRIYRTIDDAQMLGAVKATMSIGRTLAIGAFQRLRKMIEDETYKSFGYATAVDFLNSEHSPLTKNQYYDRLAAVTREGEEVFDLLNSMDISLRNRKLLAKGEIRIEGEDVVVGHEDHEERVPIADRLGVKTLIATLVEKTVTVEQRLAQEQKKNTIGQKDNEKLKRQLAEAKAKAAQVNPDASESVNALLVATGALTRLEEQLAETSPEEREALREMVFESLRQHQLRISQVYGAPKAPAHDDDLGITDEEATEMLES
jgi:hypothetical protein